MPHIRGYCCYCYFKLQHLLVSLSVILLCFSDTGSAQRARRVCIQRNSRHEVLFIRGPGRSWGNGVYICEQLCLFFMWNSWCGLIASCSSSSSSSGNRVVGRYSKGKGAFWHCVFESHNVMVGEKCEWCRRCRCGFVVVGWGSGHAQI